MPGAAHAADRESRTEALLVDGLDQYFVGNFDEAIHLWTRVLFIDRTHARARAYISRARTAQGERLRRADEMLHAAGDLLERGDYTKARHLLAGAEQASGADEKVAALWAQLERVERTRPGPAPANPAAVVDVRPLRDLRRSVRQIAQIIAAAAFAVLIYSAAASPVVGEWMVRRPSSPVETPAVSPRQLDVLSRQDVALVRARNLYARGRLAEALDVLNRVGDGAGSQREAIDGLRVEIQRWLLMSRQPASGTRPDVATGGRP